MADLLPDFTPNYQIPKPKNKDTRWGYYYNRFADRLDRNAFLGGFAVVPGNIDRSSGLAIDRRILVAPGYVLGFDGVPVLRSFPGLFESPTYLTANSITYIWIDEAYDLQMTPALAPLAIATTDANRIIDIDESIRHAYPIHHSAGYMWRLSMDTESIPGGDFPFRNDMKTTGFLIDATGGDKTIELPPRGPIGDRGQVVIVTKGDDSAHTVTVGPAAGDAGPTVVLAAQWDACFYVTASGVGGQVWARLKFI